MHHLVKVRQFDSITLDMSDMLNVCLQMVIPIDFQILSFKKMFHKKTLT